MRDGDMVDAHVPIVEGRTITVRAEVVHYRADELSVEVGLRFQDVPLATADTISDVVMAALGRPAQST
jgi:hypothetical protein